MVKFPLLISHEVKYDYPEIQEIPTKYISVSF